MINCCCMHLLLTEVDMCSARSQCHSIDAMTSWSDTSACLPITLSFAPSVLCVE